LLTSSNVKTFFNLFSDQGVISANYANFGYIPYGQTILGHFHFDAANKDGCNEYADADTREIKRSQDVTPFFFAWRGECSFVQKVRNMENIGVAVGIVIDTMAGSGIMSDDGTGSGIRIPSMLISKKDGERLLNWYYSAT